jgi:uncharacterized membrane protein
MLKFKKPSGITMDFLGIVLIAYQFGSWMKSLPAGMFMGLLLVHLYHLFREQQTEIWKREKLRHEAASVVFHKLFGNVEVHKYEPKSESKKHDSTDPIH